MKNKVKVPSQIALITDDNVVLLEYLKDDTPIESGPDYIAIILLMMISITSGAIFYM